MINVPAVLANIGICHNLRRLSYSYCVLDCLILSYLEAALIKRITVLPDFNGNRLRIEAVTERFEGVTEAFETATDAFDAALDTFVVPSNAFDSSFQKN